MSVETRVLWLLICRLPDRWVPGERERWLAAFVAALDLAVEDADEHLGVATPDDTQRDGA